VIHFITGKINSLKTTRLIGLYHAKQKGDGFVMIKEMVDNKVKNYQLMHLSTNEKNLLVVREEDKADDFIVDCQIGPYLFDKNVLSKAKAIIDQLIKDNVSPLYLDEVGILELQGQGFFSIMEQIVSSKLDAYIVVRSDLVLKVVEKFHIKEYEIIS